MEGQQLPLGIQIEATSPQAQTVECLGMTFENDERRRAYFTEKLREKLKDPEFREIEGFPIGEDEDILALSDPPYYTACPNPFIEDFINYWNYEKQQNNSTSQAETYHREPFAADVSEGKNDPIYNAHSYRLEKSENINVKFYDIKEGMRDNLIIDTSIKLYEEDVRLDIEA